MSDNNEALPRLKHDYDDDAVCVRCRFDAAEFHHMKQQGQDVTDPGCTHS